jgi:hypothetical protein
MAQHLADVHRFEPHSLELRRGEAINIQAPGTDPTPLNNAFNVTVPMAHFENGFDDASPLRICFPL